MNKDRMLTPESIVEDQHADFADGGLRPLRFADFVGQQAVCENLKVFVHCPWLEHLQ